MPDRPVEALAATPTVVQVLGDPGKVAGQRELFRCACGACADCVRRAVFLADLQRAWEALQAELP